jgi:methyl-accepting chemotaxis protein
MLKKLSVKQKIFACLTPLVVCLLIAAFSIIHQNYVIQNQTNELKKSVDYFVAVSSAIHNTQKERGKSALYLNSKITRDEITTQRKTLDEAITELGKITASIDLKTKDSTQTVIQELYDLRAYVDKNGQANESNRRFGELIGKMIELEVARAQRFPSNGLEGKLVSQSIFEAAKEEMGRLRAATNGVLSLDAPIEDSTLSAINSFKVGITSNLQSPGLIISEKTRTALNAELASPKWLEILRVLQKIQANRATGKYGENPNAFSANVTQVIDDIYTYIGAETTKIAETATELSNQARTSFWTALLVVSLVLSLMIWLASRVANEISNSLNSLSLQLSKGAEITQSSSKNLSNFSNSLSSGVTEQAAALQETVSSLEEVSAMIQKNTDNTYNLKNAATQTVSGAQSGRKALEDLIQAIDDIRLSGDSIRSQLETNNHELTEITQVIVQMAEKTKVINEIVFQTKLLSFNASVEAARAGEHGKGFAVVAEEVGNLATMSGKAAQEISQLIESGVSKVKTVIEESTSKIGNLTSASKEKVEMGVLRANTCNEAFQGVLDKIEIINRMVSEIASACSEQSQGVTEISSAMNELDQVTQENSSSATRLSSVAQELNGQAESLNEFVKHLTEIVQGEESSITAA